MEAVVRGEQAYLKEGANWMLTGEELATRLSSSKQMGKKENRMI